MRGFIVAQHSSEGRLVLAVCDSEIHGKMLEKKDVALDLSARFYKGEEMDEIDVEKLMLHSYTIHAVGKNAVAIMIKLNLGDKEDVKRVAGVPHLQIVSL